MRVYFYYNQKRYKSTANPPQAAFYSDCVFKDPTSLINPVIILNFSGKPAVNYFSIDNRYYWITDIITLNNNRWEIHGTVDVLSTYSKHIKNTHAFVLYDSTANTEIPDNRLGIKTTPTIQSNTGVMPWSFASGNGTYFVAIEGDGDLVDRGMADGATGIYITDMASIQKIGLDFDGTDVWDSFNTAMTTPFPANIKLQTTWGNINSSKDIFDAIEDSLNGGDIAGVIGYGLIGWMLLPWTFWTGIIGTIKGLITGADALKHVKSAYWLPFEFTGTGIQKNKIAIGSYIDQIGTSKRISDPIKDTYAAVTIPWQYSDWRNVQNTEIQVYIPLIGVIKIPASAVRGESVITIKCSINLFSGQFSVRLECGGVDLGTFGTNTMMPILIGDSNPDIPAITNTVVAGAALAAGAATGTAALTAGAAGAFIQSGLSSIEPLSTTVGGIGGGCGNSLGTSIVCTTICHNTSQTPSSLLSVIGTPTNKLKLLNGTGYCQTMNAQLNCNSQSNEPEPTQTEIDLINSLLDSGIYLEDTSGGGVILVPKTITANGVYNASSDNADGYNEVTVNVPGPDLATKTITANGTYLASSDNVDGFNEVIVNVSATITKTLLYTFNQSQGGAWLNTGIDMTNVDLVMFEKVDSGAINMQTLIKKSDIAVYSGGGDIYTFVYKQNGKEMNVRIYNDILYVSYGSTGNAIYETKVYTTALSDYF